MRPISLLLKDDRVRLRAAYGLILALGLLFSGLIFVYSEDVLNSTRRLTGAELPLLNKIAALKVEIMREEAALYDYYVSEDRERFRREFTDRQQRSLALFFEIQHDEAAYSGLMRQIRADHDELGNLARDMSQILSASPTPHGEAYNTLWRAANLVHDMHSDLDALSGVVQARVRDSTKLMGATVRRMARLGVLFSLGIFLIAVFVGHYIDIYVRESAERRRLAVFAERNPNPVMRLSLTGEVIYANAAATELAKRMGAPSARVLLPEDLNERLAALRGPEDRYQVWAYERAGRVFEGGIHFLRDLSSFHAYVADVTERRQSEERLVYQAYHHPLTGRPNRRMFQEVVEQALRSPEQRDRHAAVLLLDIDRLKVVMETLGHPMVDEVLKGVADRLQAVLDKARELAPGAALYHFEADLYAVFVPGMASEQVPALLAEKLAAAGALLYVGGREFSVSFSIGVAVYPIDGADAFTLLKNADSALDRVKRQGGNGFRLYKPEMNAMAAHWLSLESYLRHAIERDELRLHYQPQVDVRRGRVVGMEALLRWEHPERGLLAPKEFIGIAEESGLIDDMGEWALHEACVQTQDWRKRGIHRATVAVNISGRQFHRQNLPALVGGLLAETGLPAESLELEITESVAMQDVERTAGMLRELKGMGVRLAIDDFGTGFSSLAYLKRFPIDKLKIDQSFVQHVNTDGADNAIAHAIVSLGHALKLTVCAEGVETRAQLARLRQSECDQAQGVFYSGPVPPAQIEALLKGNRRLAPAASTRIN
jgi:diguanylate cyclase (GGDEF)-like protein